MNGVRAMRMYLQVNLNVLKRLKGAPQGKYGAPLSLLGLVKVLA